MVLSRGPLFLLIAIALGAGPLPQRAETPIEEQALIDLIEAIARHTIEPTEGLVERLRRAAVTSLSAQLAARTALPEATQASLARAAETGDLAAGFAAVDPSLLAAAYPGVARDTVAALGDRYAQVSVLTRQGLAADLASLLLPVGPGLGARQSNGSWMIDFVQRGLGGDFLGLMPGDQIVAVGGVPTDQVREPPAQMLASPVELTITRAGWPAPLALAMGGAQHEALDTVAYELLPGGIGYVRFAVFFQGVTPMFIAALHSLAALGARSLLVDLRGNGGGLINEAVALADVLVPGRQSIASVEAGADTLALSGSGLRPSYQAQGASLHPEWAMVLLLDRSSASATEFLAGCLRQNGRALLVGEQSFGKGVGQIGVPVLTIRPDSFLPLMQVLVITAFRLHLPDGGSVHGVGLVPDVVSRAPAPARATMAAVATWWAHAEHRDRLQEALADAGVAAMLAQWDPGEPLPAHLLDTNRRQGGRKARHRRIAAARGAGSSDADRAALRRRPSRDPVLRCAIETLLVHRGDDRHALDRELPPLVLWPR
ncbi:MAG: S41 family peptidase [Planctomycetota bacterium]